MTNLFALLVITFAVYRMQMCRRSRLHEAYQFRLYSMRDKLRMKAIDGRVATDNWVFDYLDKTLTKVAIMLPQLSIYNFIGIYLSHRRDDMVLEIKKLLDQEIHKPENASLQCIVDDFTDLMAEYFLARHSLLVKCFGMMTFYRKSIKPRINLAIGYITSLPETSDVLSYAV